MLGRGVRSVALALLLMAPWRAVRCGVCAPDLTLERAADGTLVIVGNRWHPGGQLVVSLAQDCFTASVDSGGGFEAATNLMKNQGSPAVQHLQNGEMAFAMLPETTTETHPLAVLFAQSLASSAVLLTGLGAALRLALVVSRTVFERGLSCPA